MILGSRVRQARELHGLTQTKLAENLGISQASIARLEQAGAPTSDLLPGLARELGFSESWFRSEPILLSEGTLRHRAHVRSSALDRSRARRWAELAVEMYLYLGQSMKLPPVTVPSSVDREIDLETTVQDVRAALGLPPDQPIRNLTRLLEHDGAIVLALPYDRDTGQDAFSTRIQDRPLIATLRGAPPDRLRHSLAHELGHLVLHGDAPFGGREVEKEADQFAGAFLLPAEVATDELNGPMTIERLLELKERWGISMRALIVRANALDLISTRTYQRWIQSLNARYGGTSEPGSNLIPHERPRALAQMAEMAWGSMSPRIISEHLHVGPFVAASLASCYQQSNSRQTSAGNATVTHLKPADDA